MNLNNFESFIDKKILARGREYIEDCRVLSVEETGHNVFEAGVEGTELYSVEVELDAEGNIIDTSCDCPYDMGEYCKHQAAVLLTLRDMKPDLFHESKHSTQLPSKSDAKPTARKPDKVPDIRGILAGRTKDELVEILANIADENEEIGRRIELSFFIGSGEEEIKQSVKLIRAYIRQNSDRHGFVDYENAYEAIEGASLVLDKARADLKKKKITQAIDLTLCVIHEMVDLMESADDSDGVIGGAIEEALAFVGEITQAGELNTSDKECVFRKLAEESISRRYEGWTDWKLNFLERCSELADTPTLRDECDKLLRLEVQNKDKDSWRNSYLGEKINLIRYNMIEKNDGLEKARDFLNENLEYPNFRKMAIEGAMREQDYDSVERLALNGEKLDHDKCGLVKRWMEYRYAAYQKSGNLKKQRAVAMEIILDGSFEYYMELKRTYSANDWLSVYPQIISQLEDQKKTYYALYSQILIEETEKHKLLEYVEERPSEVGSYYIYLLPEFKQEVCGMFLQNIEQAAERSSNRKEYQRVCATIRSLKTAGGKEQAEQVKQKLLIKYPNRPAFRDELSKV